MANYDDKAFNSMNNSAGGDMYISGGSILMSEYEQNMTPDDQSRFEDTLMQRFQMAYARDPYKQNLDFKHWLQTINPELYEERALKYDDIKAQNNGVYKLMNMDPMQSALIEDAGLLQQLAHLHTGRIEDLVTIVESNADDMPAAPQMPGMAPPQGMPPRGAPPQGPESPYEGGGDQGPF